ncbi:hypothetical protein MHBO_003303 [Bonamia ostreae]|uniref:Uncharacterized protein n=1 Tax=Bonamia ostreae TaxID=126728 RepID=A0ABV2AQY5_9EUKA
MHACASVISRSIKSVYPPVNGILDLSVSILNTVFPPRGLKSRHTVTLLWFNCSLSHIPGKWSPNHFVPLLSNDQNVPVVDLTSELDFPPLAKSNSKSCPVKSASVPNQTSSSQNSGVSKPDLNSGPSSSFSPISSPVKSASVPNKNSSPQAITVDSSPQASPPLSLNPPSSSSELHEITSVSCISSSDIPLDVPYSNPPSHSLHGKFLENKTVSELVKERKEVFQRWFQRV